MEKEKVKDKRNLALPVTNEQMNLIKGYQAISGKSNSDLSNEVVELIREKYKNLLSNLANKL